MGGGGDGESNGGPAISSDVRPGALQTDLDVVEPLGGGTRKVSDPLSTLNSPLGIPTLSGAAPMGGSGSGRPAGLLLPPVLLSAIARQCRRCESSVLNTGTVTC